jgi:WD40 repeat protein
MKKSIWLALFMAVMLVMANGCFQLSISADKPDIYAQTGHLNGISSVAFSPNGKYVISGSGDKTLKLWEASTSREVRTFSGHTHAVNCVAYSPDGRFVASGGAPYDETVKLFDVSNGKLLWSTNASTVHSLAFSADGKYIASGTSHSIYLIDVARGKITRELSGFLGTVWSLAFSPDGRCLVSAIDKKIKFWDVPSGKETLTLEGHSGEVCSVAFSPNGKQVVSASGDKSIKLWEISTGKEINTFKGHKDWVCTVAFSPNGKNILSGSWDYSLKLWDIESGNAIWTAFDNRRINSVAFSPDGLKIASGGGFMPKIWDVSNGKRIDNVIGDNDSSISEVSSIAISNDSRYLIAGKRNFIELWDMSNGTKIRTFNGHSDEVESVAFSPDGKYIVSGSDDKEPVLKLWDITTGREIKTMKGHNRRVTSISFSPDGKYIVSGSWDRTIKLWETTTGKQIWTNSENSDVWSVAFSPDGLHVISGDGNYILKLLKTTNGQETWKFLKHTNISSNMSVAYSPNGKYVASGSYALILWEAETGKKVKIFQGHTSNVFSIAFSPDSNFFISGSSDHTIKLWDIEDGRSLVTYYGHNNDVTSVGYISDGKYVVSGSNDGTIRQWNTKSGQELAQFISFTDNEWITITPEGYYNASPNGDKHLNVRIGNNVYGIENYREAFYRPDLVKIALAGGSLKDYRNIASVKQPPQMHFINTPEKTGEGEAKVTLRMTDMGGGIGDVRLYLNGSAVVLDNARGLKVVAKDDGKSVTRSYTVKLTNGTNSIRAIVFNADNSMQSNDALHEIIATFKTISKPSLHALVIGIKEFKNPKLQLKYTVADAELFSETLKKSAGGLFDKINIKKLTTKEETTRDNIKNELKAFQKLNPDDLFVLYVASHGTVDDGEYFLITSNVGSTMTQRLKSDALTQTELKELVANIPTTKKVIVLDTCNAGAMGDAMQVAMLTRGMSEDTAIKILSRAVGSTILSASTSAQEAVEGYQGHGLFTWVLSEGLSGKADKAKSGFIKTTDLADYVDSEVPLLAEKVFKRAQYPTISISGQPFHIGKVK